LPATCGDRTLESVPSFDDVRRIVSDLPGSEEGRSRDHLFWRVKGKGFVWERPLRGPDLAELGDRAPPGPLLGVRVQSLAAKQALLADPSGVYFATSHFDGHPVVLVTLDDVAPDELRELVIEAWLCRAPPALARAYTREHPDVDEL
jgi:hypothetical protein